MTPAAIMAPRQRLEGLAREARRRRPEVQRLVAGHGAHAGARAARRGSAARSAAAISAGGAARDARRAPRPWRGSSPSAPARLRGDARPRSRRRRCRRSGRDWPGRARPRRRHPPPGRRRARTSARHRACRRPARRHSPPWTGRSRCGSPVGSMPARPKSSFRHQAGVGTSQTSPSRSPARSLQHEARPRRGAEQQEGVAHHHGAEAAEGAGRVLAAQQHRPHRPGPGEVGLAGQQASPPPRRWCRR